MGQNDQTKHWTENAYCEHATLFYEVDVSIYEDDKTKLLV